MSKNDLSAFRRKPTKEKVLTTTPTPTKKRSKTGAPKKAEKEKLSQRIQTMITEDEFKKLEADRGAVPMSAFLRMKLKEAGII